MKNPLYLGTVALFAMVAGASCTPTDSSQKSPLALDPPMAGSPAQYADICMQAQAERVPVIMYHDVIKKRDKNAVWFDCTAADFKDQMQWLQGEGVTPISLDELYKHLTTGSVIPAKAVVLTFDDNYQGFFDYAYPVLKQHRFPAAMFVHTGFVGNKEGTHPKMDWATLTELIKDPLITIGSHTVTHPADITQLDPDEQTKELNVSKAVLEKHLGKPMDYFAYPDGKNDQAVQQLVKAAGYKMAVTMVNGPAEESPNIYCVNRYIETRLEKSLDDCDLAVRGGAPGVFEGNIRTAPVTYVEGLFVGVKLGLIEGGTPISVLSDTREGVRDFIHRIPGTVAGINGGFFAMAAIHTTDNRMVGPLKTADMPAVIPDDSPERWVKLHNRPLVMWGPTQFGIVPYQPAQMRTDAQFKQFMPDYTDTFMAGVWLIHGGVARPQEDLDVFASLDIEDPRKRALIGVMGDGRIVLCASISGCTSAKFAEAAAAAGVQEAVLLDSGFSTSLVYGDDVKASGHAAKDVPSRPVPHVILLKGELDPATASLGIAGPATLNPVSDEKPVHRRRHRRRPTS